MEVNGKKYEDLDYYEKLALNSNWDTNVNIIDLVHARAALVDKEQV